MDIDWQSQPDWLREQVDEHADWFNIHLPVPRRLSVPSKGRHLYVGLCWFRPEACEHISRARELARLIAETGAVTRQIGTHRPGQVLYRDDFQIVAKPERSMPLPN